MRVDESYQLPPEINLAAEVHQLIKELEDYSSSSAKIPGKQGRQLIDNQTRTSILFYGTSWCGDCRRARRFFDERNIPYTWIDIDADREARKFVEETNNGFRSVPTIVFPDSSILVEPSTAELEKKLVG
ncbi:MAG: hypothetical protein IT308_08545 [Anaerolineaceae bacterium]|nr:hypothetical protein [Anaerolineaceae bacterium]